MQKIKYDVKRFDWSGIISDVLGVKGIELSELRRDGIDVFRRENDQSTIYHKLFYEFTSNITFKSLYTSFIKEVVRPLYDESMIYQTIPTFRICFPENIAVGEFHRDKWYRDGKWADKVKEDNFFLPFTHAFGTNTIQVESEEGKCDYSPMECAYGCLIKWDGSNLMHGNYINKTGKCRVSVDFRVIKFSNYIPSEHGSINMKTKFKLGNYYSFMQ